MRSGKKQYTVFLPEELAEKVAELAAEEYDEHLPVATYIRIILSKHVKEVESKKNVSTIMIP